MPVDIDGLADLFEDLDDLQDSYGDDGPTWVTGTNVEYAPHLEFGTSPHTIEPDDADALRWEDAEGVHFAMSVDHPGIDPKPFFRPAIAEVKLQGVEDFIEDNTELQIGEIDSTEELVSTLALALEGRIKEIITRKGLVDTGRLRISISAVPLADVSSLPSADEISV